MKQHRSMQIRVLALAAAIALLAAFAAPGFAANTKKADAGSASALPAGFLEYLAQSAKKCETTVDVSAYEILMSDEVNLAVRTYLYDERPDLFHLTGPVNFTYYPGGPIVSVHLQYTCSAEEYAAKLKQVEDAAAPLLAGLGKQSLTDVQRALLLHDRLAVHCAYDMGTYTGENPGFNSRNIYGALVERSAACDGYTRAYQYLLSRVGIRSRINRSATSGHSWNIVYIGGKAYHVDVTFDDPIIDITGRVSHENFLLSSDALYKSNHAWSDYDTEPSDTRYDDYFWQRSNASFLLVSGKLYYVDSVDASLKRYDGKKIASISPDWNGYFANGGNNKYCYARCATDGVMLLYSDKKTVYEYDPATGKTQVVFSLSSAGSRMIFGMKLENGKIVCDLAEAPGKITADKTGLQESKAYALHSPTIKMGDPDGDGVISSGDARLALRASVGLEKYAQGSVPFRACDTDGDDVVSSSDARLILRASVGLEDAALWG